MCPKLWIFKPSDHWNYCGGVVIILSTNWEGCKIAFDQWLAEESKRLKHTITAVIYQTQEETKEQWDAWVLWRTYEVPCVLRGHPQVELVEYNYA